MSEDGIDGWQDDDRRDGALVVVTDLGYWVAIVAGHAALTECPCCDKPLATARAAKLVCNAVYPLPDA